MASFTGIIMFMLCCLAAKSTESEVSEMQKCPITRKMEVLPGRGWDNLRNKDMGQVLKLRYDKCKITEDGVYLLPDHVSTIPIKQSKLDLTSELIEHYSDYTSVTAHSFKAEASASYFGMVTVSASFSTDYQNAKRRQVDDKSMTTRVQVRNTMYLVVTEPSAEVDPSLKAMITEAAHDIETENTEKAQLIMEFIVRDYGTHILSQVEAGAILAKEDFISSKFVEDYSGAKSEICAAASASFFSTFSFGTSYSQSHDEELTERYKKSTTSSHVRTYGGSLLEPNMTVHRWSAETINNLVATDRSGDSLTHILTPQKFTNIPLETLGQLRLLLEGAINDYYSFNTHAGCMNVSSPNFEYNANVNDQACNSSYSNYTFGGAYQTCQLKEEYDGNICRDFLQTNPLTGEMSCPPGYIALLLHSGMKSSTGFTKQCPESCDRRNFPFHCDKMCRRSLIAYDAYWCVAVGSVADKSGVMFGGLYSAVTVNPVTKSQTCPITYVPLLLGESLRVCISNDYEGGRRYSVPFGGFFSCSQGNILVHDESDGKVIRQQNNPYHHSCPGGYSQHMATIDYNCEINYCVKANAFGVDSHLPIVRPPFLNPTALYAKPTPKSTISQAAQALSDGSIAGIAIGCIVVLITIVVGGIVLRRRRIRNSAPGENNGRELLTNEERQYGSVNDTIVPVSPEV